MSLRPQWLAPGEAPPPAFTGLHQAGGYRQADDPLWPDAWGLLLWRGEQAVARLSGSRAPDLRGAGGEAGMLGHYEAEDAEAGVEALRLGLARLAHEGVRKALGPLNGSTWRRYRLNLGPADEAPFLGEPENRLRYAADFEAAGFSVCERYETRALDLAEGGGSLGLSERLRARWRGRSRPLDLGRYEQELLAIHRLSLQAFDQAVLYTPQSEAAFLAQYGPYRGFYAPDFVRLIEDEKGLAAYVVAYPDGERLVLKTLASRPDARLPGLIPYLIEEVQVLACQRGLKRVLHALMHEDNASNSISQKLAQPCRRYALYAKDLGA
jgi:hypothetical protein